MFANRSVIEIMILSFTAVVVLSVLFTGAAVAIIEIRDPTVDTSAIVNSLTSIIIGIMGALLGLLAGKSEAVRELGLRPDGSADHVHLPGEDE